MNLIHRNLLVTLSLLVFSLTAAADTLVLKDGKVLQGTFKGGTAEAVQFEVSGKIEAVPLSNITSLTFSPREVKAAAQPAPAAAAGAATAAHAGGTVPAGTKLTLKTTDAVGTDSSPKGSKFTAALEADVAVNGQVVVHKGTVVYGTVLESVGGRRVGNQRILVTFTEISINNQMIPIVTDDVGAEGGRGSAARAVGAGALVGAAAGDAGAGALVGAGVSLLAGGNHIQVPAGTLVEVSLKQPVTIP